jgi:hypothetical protein
MFHVERRRSSSVGRGRAVLDLTGDQRGVPPEWSAFEREWRLWLDRRALASSHRREWFPLPGPRVHPLGSASRRAHHKPTLQDAGSTQPVVTGDGGTAAPVAITGRELRPPDLSVPRGTPPMRACPARAGSPGSSGRTSVQATSELDLPAGPTRPPSCRRPRTRSACLTRHPPGLSSGRPVRGTLVERDAIRRHVAGGPRPSARDGRAPVVGGGCPAIRSDGWSCETTAPPELLTPAGPEERVTARASPRDRSSWDPTWGRSRPIAGRRGGRRLLRPTGR